MYDLFCALYCCKCWCCLDIPEDAEYYVDENDDMYSIQTRD